MYKDRITLAHEVREELLCKLEKMGGQLMDGDKERLWFPDANRKFYVTLYAHPKLQNVYVVNGFRTPENIARLRRNMLPGSHTYVVQYGEIREFTDLDAEHAFRGAIRRTESESEPKYMRTFYEGGGDCARPQKRFKAHSKRDPELSVTRFDLVYGKMEISAF